MILSDLDNIAYNKFANGEITLAEYIKYQNRDKIMNYEQKYKEALERMKSWVRGEHPDCFSEAQKAAEFIFPELKEGEDERIRKAIIAYISHDQHCGVSNADMIAWLEKQGKMLDTDKVIDWLRFHIQVDGPKNRI